MEWNSRQRVITTLEHREPDRVPIDLAPLVDCYLNLKEYLGIKVDEEIKPNLAMEVIPHPSVLKALDTDVISIKLGSGKTPAKPKRDDSLVEDAYGVLYRRVQQTSGSYMEVAYSPLANATLETIQHYPWPKVDYPGRLEETAETARSLYENTDLALMGRFGGPIIETAVYLMGFENWLLCTAEAPDVAGYLLDRLTDIMIEMDRIGLEATAPYLQIFKVSGEDLGTQNGLLYSPRMLRSLILPRFQRRWQAARDYLDTVNPDCKIMLHSCGSVRRIIPDLIASGIQVLNPIQPRAKDMDSFELKQEFGDQLAFHGGVDIQEVLPFGTKEEVEAEVKTRIQALAPGGGYILSTSHFIQADTPPENVVTMCEAAHKYGRYPLSL
jgi:uroporphyrinogen decarboxylase